MPSDGQAPIVYGRRNLLDFFYGFADLSAEYLYYDDGYRSWKYSYAQVGRAAKGFAVRLSKYNISKGHKVIFWSENRPEWIAAFWGCVLVGAVVVPIDYRSSPQFLRRVQQSVDCRLFLIGEEVQLLSWEGQPPAWRLSEVEWSTESPKVPEANIGRDDVVEIVFTSGATDQPKGVIITHRNILANIVSPEQIVSKYAKWFRPLFPLRFLCLIPLSHMFGQVLTLFIVPLIPGVAVFMRGYSPHEIVRQTRTRRISILVAVPKILEVLQKYVLREIPEAVDSPFLPSSWTARWRRYRRLHSLFGWKFWAFVVGGAALAKELEEFWRRLGLVVVQGYGLTETAPLVAFNNPFGTKQGTVGKPVAGVEIKIAPDGELLVRGESVTSGYYAAPVATALTFERGWFHTGDLGYFDPSGNLVVRGRKKEMIVTPEGLKIFPADVETVLNKIPGVRESAVVGKDRVHAILVLEDQSDPNEIIRRANLQLEDYQRIRSVSIWPGNRLPRTEGTQKLKHAEIESSIEKGTTALDMSEMSGSCDVIELLHKYAPGRAVTPDTTLGELGLSSLDRVELIIDLEQRLDQSIDEDQLTGGQTIAELSSIGHPPSRPEFPTWNRSWLAKCVRNFALSALWLPLTRTFAHPRILGLEHLAALRGPVIFAPNHQSHLDTPLILSALPARYRFHIAVAMWKEYFDAHFYPERHTRYEKFRDSILYRLVALFFNAFPLPQAETGARQSLRYIGDLVGEDWSILFFPEGERTESGEIKPFRPGIGLIAARLGVTVVPIRLHGVEKILHRHWRWPHAGPVEITFGPPLHLRGDDYAALAKQVEEAVIAL